MILLLLVIGWVMKTSTGQKQNGIQWTFWTQLDYLDFADDLDLLSHTQQQMQEKTNTFAETSTSLGFNINREKSKVLKINTASKTTTTLGEEVLYGVDCFSFTWAV